MIPVIAIVGRPNTGKSTLFNRITRSRNALVADSPGVTRDRNYGFAIHNEKRFIVIDTGGLEDIDADNQAMADLVSEQSWLAIHEAEHILWLVDGRNGLTAIDEVLSAKLRPYSAKIHLLVNKTEGLDTDTAVADFHALGAGTPLPVSAQRGHGIDILLDNILADIAPEELSEDIDSTLKISVIGRPNVGKSTLINRMIGEDRLLTFDQPGTTRDSISIPFERNGKQYELIDTAGVRRRPQNYETIEKYSVIKSLQAIENCHLIIAVIDASEALTDQDLHLLGITHESGKPLIIAVNKWDNLDKNQRYVIKDQLDRKLSFVDYASIHFISALHGSGVGKLFGNIDKIGRLISIRIKSSKLTDLLIEAVNAHAPPMVNGRRIKLRYAHLGGHNPLRVIIHGNQTENVPANYTRYLANYYRAKLRLTGIPVMIEFKYSDNNPYKDKRNILTTRQLNKRRRMIKNRK